MYDLLEETEKKIKRPKRLSKLKIFLRIWRDEKSASRKEVTNCFDLDKSRLNLDSVVKSNSKLGFNLYKIVEVFYGKDTEVLVEPLKGKKTNEQEQYQSEASERSSSESKTAMENKRPSKKTR